MSEKFKPFIAHATCCDSLMLMMRPRAYVSCKCGGTSVDAGNGFYHRLNVKEGIQLPPFYWQAKKGSLLMVRKKKKR